jgi:hypothetical protein
MSFFSSYLFVFTFLQLPHDNVIPLPRTCPMLPFPGSHTRSARPSSHPVFAPVSPMLPLFFVTASSFLFFFSFVAPVLPSALVTVVLPYDGASGLGFTLALLPATTADAHP